MCDNKITRWIGHAFISLNSGTVASNGLGSMLTKTLPAEMVTLWFPRNAKWKCHFEIRSDSATLEAAQDVQRFVPGQNFTLSSLECLKQLHSWYSVCFFDNVPHFYSRLTFISRRQSSSYVRKTLHIGSSLIRHSPPVSPVFVQSK